MCVPKPDSASSTLSPVTAFAHSHTLTAFFFLSAVEERGQKKCRRKSKQTTLRGSRRNEGNKPGATGSSLNIARHRNSTFAAVIEQQTRLAHSLRKRTRPRKRPYSSILTHTPSHCWQQIPFLSTFTSQVLIVPRVPVTPSQSRKMSKEDFTLMLGML